MSDKQSRSTFHNRKDRMVAGLKEDIKSGKYPVGSFLPSEVELGKLFQLSKNSVRKVLDILADDNFIERIPSVGTRICFTESSDKVTIRLGYYSSLMEQADLNLLLTDFQNSNPHISVQAIPLTFDHYYETIINYLKHGLLDIFTINQTDFYYLKNKDYLDWIEPLNPLPSLYPFLNKPFTYENNQYALPFIFSPVVLCYNKKHFKENKIPAPDSSWTWDDLMIAASKLMKDNSHFGFYFYLLSLNRWPNFLLQSGDKIRSEQDGEVKLCGTNIEKALEFSRELVRSKVFPPHFIAENSDDAELLFLQEKVSMIMTTYFSMNYLKEASFSFDISPLPFIKQPASLLSTIGVGINRKSAYKSAAKALIDYLVSERAQMLVRQNTHSIPSLIKAAESNVQGKIRHPKHYHTYSEVIPAFKSVEDLNISYTELNLMHNELKMFWSGMEQVRDVCQRLEMLLSKRQSE